MKTIKNLTKAFSLVAFLSAGLISNAQAQTSSESALLYSGMASVGSANAVGHSLAAVGKTALGIAAVPLIGVGKIGELSGQAGSAMYEASELPFEIGEAPLTVSQSPRKQILSEGE